MTTTPTEHTPGDTLAHLHDVVHWLDQRGHPPPCRHDPDAWQSQHAAVRAKAALKCVQACPILTLCGAAADDLAHESGVWGGVDHG